MVLLGQYIKIHKSYPYKQVLFVAESQTTQAEEVGTHAAKSLFCVNSILQNKRAIKVSATVSDWLLIRRDEWKY